MKLHNKLALACGVFAVLALAPLPAQISTEKPVTVRTINNVKPVKPKWHQWRVIAATPASLVVRDMASERTIVTFSYSDKVRGKMQKIIDNGGYQYGDKVRIRHDQGQTVALDLKGRPSRP
jgi:hypothetical protein